jgi:histone H3/H4
MARKHYLAWSPIRELMKSCGAQMVSKEAVDAVIAYEEDHIKTLTSDALKLTAHSKRTKLTKDDIELILKMRRSSSVSNV